MARKKILTMNDIILEMESCTLKSVKHIKKYEYRHGNDKRPITKYYYKEKKITLSTAAILTFCSEICEENARPQNYSTYILLTNMLPCSIVKNIKNLTHMLNKKRFQLSRQK